MADAASSGGLAGPLCEVCSQPMPAGSRPLRVGACEFPFHVHDDCQAAMGPLADEIAFICSGADEQPDGLLWLGSWDALAVDAGGDTDGDIGGDTSGKIGGDTGDAAP